MSVKNLKECTNQRDFYFWVDPNDFLIKNNIGCVGQIQTMVEQEGNPP
jgi:hypothetical protein